MRITLPSGTEAEFAEPSDSDDEATMGLVIAPDIFGLRPLFDDMVGRLVVDLVDERVRRRAVPGTRSR